MRKKRFDLLDLAFLLLLLTIGAAMLLFSLSATPGGAISGRLPYVELWPFTLQLDIRLVNVV